MARTSGSSQLAAFRLRPTDLIGFAGAEEDSEFLSGCFVDTGALAILENPEDNRIIVQGRTGAGKTALVLKLKDRHPGRVLILSAESLALAHVSNSTVIRFFDDLGVNLDPFFKLLWRHVLTVELLKTEFAGSAPEAVRGFWDTLTGRLRGSNRRVNGGEEAISYLRNWGEKFWETTDRRVREVTSKIERDLSLEAAAKMGEMFEIRPLAARKLTDETRTELAERGQRIVADAQVEDLSRALDVLNGLLSDKQKHYYLVVDRLDEKWVDDKIRYRLILALLGAAKEFIRVRNAKVVVCLRRDLVERVFRLTRSAGDQEEKYQSLYLPVVWTQRHLLEVLDRRVTQLVRSRYSGSEVVGYRDLLPKNVKGMPIDDFIGTRARRPRDVIAFFNACIRAGADAQKLSVDRLRNAEGEYSKDRFRALGDEWEADYPGLLDAAQVLLRGRPASFKLDSLPRQLLEDLALRLALDSPEGKLGSAARQCAEAFMGWEAFRNHCFDVFYRVGLVGLKVDRSQVASWADELGRGVTSAEIDGSTSALTPQMYWRVLNIRE